MVQVLKKILCGVLICALLTGCSNVSYLMKERNQPEVAMGRYLEETIEIGDKNKEVNFYEGEDHKIHALIVDEKDQYCSYTQEEDDTWQLTDSSLCDAIKANDTLNGVLSIESLPEQGKIYVIGEAKGEEVPYIGKFEDNKLERIQMAWESDREFIKEAVIDSKERLYILNRSDYKVHQWDLKTGKNLGTIGDNVATFTVVNNEVYAEICESWKIECYDADTYKLKQSIEEPVRCYEGRMVKASDEGGIYLVNREGVYYFAKGEVMAEKIMDGDLYSFSTPSRWLDKIKAYGGIIYAVFGQRDNGEAFVKYIYHDEVETIPKNQISIFAMKDCFTLRQAAQIYREKHPDANINFDIAISEGNYDFTTLDKQQVLERLNTQLISGEGPDMIILDDLPIQSYIDRGALIDLRSVVDEADQNGELLDSMINTYQTGEELFAVPLRFTLIYATGKKQYLKDGFDLEKLAKIQKEHPDEQILFTEAPRELIKNLAPYWNDKLFNEGGDVNTASMASFLSSIKLLHHSKEDEYKTLFWVDVTGDFMEDRYKMALGKLNSFMDVDCLQYIKDKGNEMSVTSNIEGKANKALPKKLIGINKGSTKVEESKELLSIALSKEVQKGAYDGSFGIHTTTIDTGKADLDGVGCCVYRKPNGEFVQADKIPLERMNWFFGEYKAVTPIRPMDDRLLQIILQESEAYFKGNMQLEEAVQNITSKTELYLDEQNK